MRRARIPEGKAETTDRFESFRADETEVSFEEFARPSERVILLARQKIRGAFGYNLMKSPARPEQGQTGNYLEWKKTKDKGGRRAGQTGCCSNVLFFLRAIVLTQHTEDTDR